MRSNVILLIEDNKHDEFLTLRALKKHGIQHEMMICRDGAEAIDWIFRKNAFANRNPSIVPAVVLLDLKLPKFDGLEVLKAIRSNLETRSWPVVILTTSQEESDIAQSYAGGANSFVQKPVDFDEFSEAVRTLGIYWLLMNQKPPLVSGLR